MNRIAKCKDILEQIEGVFEEVTQLKALNKCIFIYYTGHGSGGDWCFKDGRIKLNDIKQIANKYYDSDDNSIGLHIFSQCCQSGNWCERLKDIGFPKHMYINIRGSSRPGKFSRGNSKGSTWTRYMFNDEQGYAKSKGLKWTRGMINGLYRYQLKDANDADNARS